MFNKPGVPRRYTVKVKADGPFGPVEELSYDIDLNDLMHSDISAPVSKKLVEEVRQVHKAIERIARNGSGERVNPWVGRQPAPADATAADSTGEAESAAG